MTTNPTAPAQEGEQLPLNCDRDPARWAREFNEALTKLYPWAHLCDEGWLIGWFANAMMCGEDTYRWRQLAATPLITPPDVLDPSVYDDAAPQEEAPEYPWM